MPCQYVVRHRRSSREKTPEMPLFGTCSHPAKRVRVGHVMMELCKCHVSKMKRSLKYKKLMKRKRKAQEKPFRWRKQ